MHRTLKSIGILSIATFAIAGCDTRDGRSLQNTRNSAAIGAAIGAVGGLIIGDDHESAVRGAVAGGIVGGIVGHQLDKQEAELRDSIGDSGAVITNTGSELVVSLPEAITFATDSTEVRSSLRPSLNELAQSLLKYPETTVDVIGHTDSVGDAGYNQNLSARRAAPVRNILTANGVPTHRIRAFGQGETSPSASNETQAGRAENRRVEIIIRPTA